MQPTFQIYEDEFADQEFIDLNLPFYEAYVELRVLGHSQRDAFIRVFGEDNLEGEIQQQHKRLAAIERTPWFLKAFDDQLNSIDVKKLWSPKKSAHHLLTLVHDIFAKDSVRLNAIKELNVLAGITIVDESGKTRAGRSLADFYAQNGTGKTPDTQKAVENKDAPANATDETEEQ